MTDIKRVFMSYSHDTPEHSAWVMSLASNLMSKGIDVILDKWSLGAGDDLTQFMEKGLIESDYVLMVCTENYVGKANEGKGGVGYEKMIVTADYMNDANAKKAIPIIRQQGTTLVPIFLGTKLYINLSVGANFETGFDEICREILDAPLYKKPELGTNPYDDATPDIVPEPEQTSDPEAIVIMSILAYFEQGHTAVYENVRGDITGMSRVMFDLVIDKLTLEGLITDGKIRIMNRLKRVLTLTTKGKRHLLEKGFIT